MKTKRSDAAFPVPGVRFNDDNFIDGVEGLTKREYFAVMAMQGDLASDVGHDSIEECARDAVRYADALIEALNKEQP